MSQSDRTGADSVQDRRNQTTLLILRLLANVPPHPLSLDGSPEELMKRVFRLCTEASVGSRKNHQRKIG